MSTRLIINIVPISEYLTVSTYKDESDIYMIEFYVNFRFLNVASIKPKPLEMKEYIMLMTAHRNYEERLLTMYE